MAEVRRATRDDAARVYDLIRSSTLRNAALPSEARARLFEPVWGGEEDYYGYVLEAEGEVVGFIGMLFTRREIAGAMRKFCELHSWYVKDEFRSESLMLLLPALSIKGMTLLNYTPSPEVYEISRKFGFAELEQEVLRILPVPTPGALRADLRVETDEAAIGSALTGSQLRIFEDHRGLDCRHFLVRRRGRSGHLYAIVKKMRVTPRQPVGRILYFSDEDRLVDALGWLRLYWSLALGVQCLIVDRAQLRVAPGSRSPRRWRGRCPRSTGRGS
ncbi:hypothetical protein [Rathayibacter tanaceti]|uniref:N-acetyltransferase domain-containing protein n=1 Tax=Rathayibacter tanaceti TaxID=1671680 RepID=A0A162G0H5_9MICO|nr:hypothetical protein [Rathayibacter tanaceti]KZX22310.1 hypothetical protein ACH61_00551 [Rathayibacter tanaceti]